MEIPSLGRVGVYLPVPFTDPPAPRELPAAAARLADAGYGTIWTNEFPGKDALVQLAVLLEATERVVFGTGVANIWTRDARTAAAAAEFLHRAHPGRLVLGLGVGYPQQAAETGREYGDPLTTMRDYVDRMGPAEYPRILGANGPKMLALAGEVADGAMPAMLPPEATALARRLLGPGKLLVAALAVMPGASRAEAVARVTSTLGQPWFARAVARAGYPADAGRLVDAVVAYGEPDAIAVKVREHLAAGADHVVLLPQSGSDFATDVEVLARLAPAAGQPV
ncbi:LLM class flavin-dependent oxidoreductase [Amycolatopsis tucumanensis]|uniref:LLM class flavin-dependent oxidoreductase n=1 Tax=Amycolatopsis tucumanensis TaxID=401106 RepID=UPI003D74BD68